MKYPTVVIQLTSDAGVPIDMPEDWLETVLNIAGMLNAKYKCGIDVAYGDATKEGFNIIDKEVMS
ncbi:MAG: hypothetical protein HOC79_05580 [Euryarchaeota archaeon]|jgi:hypothetical protein|nr:hypothetical protein [Euryarchaeota archaeon]